MGEFDVRERTPVAASEVEAGQVPADGPAKERVPGDRTLVVVVNVMLVFGILAALLTIGLVILGVGMGG